MVTERIKRCDIYDTKKSVITVSVVVAEVGEAEDLDVEEQDDKATIRTVRSIQTKTLDVSPKALERLCDCVVRGTTPPSPRKTEDKKE